MARAAVSSDLVQTTNTVHDQRVHCDSTGWLGKLFLYVMHFSSFCIVHFHFKWFQRLVSEEFTVGGLGVAYFDPDLLWRWSIDSQTVYV